MCGFTGNMLVSYEHVALFEKHGPGFLPVEAEAQAENIPELIPRR